MKNLVSEPLYQNFVVGRRIFTEDLGTEPVNKAEALALENDPINTEITADKKENNVSSCAEINSEFLEHMRYLH